MDFSLPPVGEGLIEVELVRWLVRPGDAVVPGQGLAEVMSDKATMEVPAPFAGTVTALAATPGAKVRVGEVILAYTPAGGEGGGGRMEEDHARVENGTPVVSRTATAVLPPPSSPLPPASPSVRLL